VATGGPLVDVEMACAAPAGAPPFVLEISINGRFASQECGPRTCSDAGGGSAASQDVGAGGGRPVTVTLRLTPIDNGFERGKGPSLARDVSGALVGITIRGTPYLAPLTPSAVP
jgi:hypothetical protein